MKNNEYSSCKKNAPKILKRKAEKLTKSWKKNTGEGKSLSTRMEASGGKLKRSHTFFTLG